MRMSAIAEKSACRRETLTLKTTEKAKIPALCEVGTRPAEPGRAAGAGRPRPTRHATRDAAPHTAPAHTRGPPAHAMPETVIM